VTEKLSDTIDTFAVEPVGGQLGRDGAAHAAGPAGYQGGPRPASPRISCSHESSPSAAAHRPLIARQPSVAP
jgi:hypothetical protein